MTLGQILQKHRVEQKLTYETVAERLTIQKKYLEALEKGDYASLPADIYVQCFLKLYGALLGLDQEELIALYKKERGSLSSQHVYVATKKQGALSRFFHFVIVPRLISSLVLIIVVGIFLVYIGFGVFNLMKPPALEISIPLNNTIITHNYVEIAGSTEKEVEIMVNDKPILGDPEGNFRSVINLQKGVNIIKITARNRHGRERIEYVRVMYDTELDNDAHTVGLR